jgi:hypothetical protein
VPVTERWKRMSSELVLKGQGTSVNTSYVGLAGDNFDPESLPVIGEASGAGYARVPVQWTDFVADMRNTGAIVWSVSGTWPPLLTVFVSDSSQGGGVLMYETVGGLTALTDGDVVSIALGDLILT